MTAHAAQTLNTTLERRMTLIEPPLHRPRPCPACQRESRAIVDGGCLACRTPASDPQAPHPAAPDCGQCGQRLLLVRPGRTHCAACQRPVQDGAA